MHVCHSKGSMGKNNQYLVLDAVLFINCSVAVQGTAATEEEEFYEVYGLNVAVVPPHRPRQRMDRIPRVYFE